MTIIINKSNVLLPKWILDQRSELSDYEFLKLVRGYLKSYPDYTLIYVNNYFAVCEFTTEMKTKRRKRM
jgi:hypothetical protein